MREREPHPADVPAAVPSPAQAPPPDQRFGLPLLEAKACGCLVVASSIPSTVEVAGDYPFYFEPGKEEGLLTALDGALEEGKHSPRIGQGLERAKQFSWNETAKQTLIAYRTLL